MLYYNKIDIGKEVDNSKECIIWYYWFFNHGFKFQDYECNCCHDLTMLCPNISNITIIDYRFIIRNISQSEAINLLKMVCLKYVAIHIKKFCLNFQSSQDWKFLEVFCFFV